ncbi:hypothetical protein L484_009311 [Morus notabilis]|uniref:Uncharacterized protein n=1 Tax=Morus notabilis TaxID=981085 RepID=W9R353_9ROSA|nr:hypothetical protein L484_009311 [Morus notabilis]
MDFGSAKVVEYLEPVMSKELLCKFPDNSAFDFDYSQSSIWSPLVPQAYKSMDFESDLDFATLRKLDFEVGNENRSLNKVTSNIKKRIRTTAFAVNLSALKTKKKKKKKIVSDFSPSPSFKGACNPVTKKVQMVEDSHGFDSLFHARVGSGLDEHLMYRLLETLIQEGVW